MQMQLEVLSNQDQKGLATNLVTSLWGHGYLWPGNWQVGGFFWYFASRNSSSHHCIKFTQPSFGSKRNELLLTSHPCHRFSHRAHPTNPRSKARKGRWTKERYRSTWPGPLRLSLHRGSEWLCTSRRTHLASNNWTTSRASKDEWGRRGVLFF